MKTSLSQYIVILLFVTILLNGCNQKTREMEKPRIIVSTDIGGTDPDDFQSMIHLLMYANQFDIEGIIASPYGPGRKSDILSMIDLYKQDLPKLSKHAEDFPSPDYLRSVTKQGGIDAAPFKGWTSATEGSEWIIQTAKKEDNRPLW